MGNMMEKAAYLKGLLDGLDIDLTTKEGKVFSAIVETLSEMAAAVDMQGEAQQDTLEYLDEIDEVLDDISNIIFGDEEDLDEDEEELEDFTPYVCRKCKKLVYLDPDEFDPSGQHNCPTCGELLLNADDLEED